MNRCHNHPTVILAHARMTSEIICVGGNANYAPRALRHTSNAAREGVKAQGSAAHPALRALG